MCVPQRYHITNLITYVAINVVKCFFLLSFQFLFIYTLSGSILLLTCCICVQQQKVCTNKTSKINEEITIISVLPIPQRIVN